MDAKGTAHLAPYGKQQLARSMYEKGKSFIGAALLLRRAGGYHFVVLHLLCQGVEIILKALLLFEDYDKYKPQLKKFHHDLERVAAAVVAEYGLNELRPPLRAELAALNDLYTKHLLRYGSGYDILVDPNTISSRRVTRRIAAVVRLTERQLNQRPE